MPQCESRIIIIGGGPTGIGAAVRLQELGFPNWALFEAAKECGGLSASIVDEHRFVWDIGGHVIFSHYQYYDDVVAKLGPKEFRSLQRKCVLFLDKGKNVVTYPLQNHVHQLPERHQQPCLDGLEQAHRMKDEPNLIKPKNFYEWGLQKFGQGLVDVFLRPYNEKLWAWPLEAMSCTWLGERVAVPDFELVKKQFETKSVQQNWGPNNVFKYPTRGGTGSIWTSVASHLDSSKLNCDQKIEKIDLSAKRVTTKDGVTHSYDYILSTIPLPILAEKVLTGDDEDVKRLREVTGRLKHCSVRITGLGCEGPKPDCLNLFQWSYFPDKDAPFFRCTALTNYTPHMAPQPEKQYSLLLESSCSDWRQADSTSAELVEKMIVTAKDYGLIPDGVKIVSKWHWVEEYGYPTPSVDRDSILEEIHKILLKHKIYSRGRFGGWRYESANMDHSLMQGVEAVDAILGNQLKWMQPTELSAEHTYHSPNYVNDPANRSKVPFTQLKPAHA